MRAVDASPKGQPFLRMATWAFLALGASPAAFAAITLFSATLDSAQEVPTNASMAFGNGTVLLDDVAGTITVNETWGGLTSTAIASHIHGPALPGFNAPVLFSLAGVPPATAGGIAQQVFAITPAQITQLKSGSFYFNVHSMNFPGGEIRGQIPAAAGCAENFDSLTAPALPVGWTTASSGSLPAWTTSTTNPASAPNAAFAPAVENIGLTELITPDVPINFASAQLTFRNLYNMEMPFDGMVLEISDPSVNAGAYQDIITAGGSFVTGGYNTTISGGFGNPLGTRPGWTGLSGGTVNAPAYITTTVNLPASANGHLIKLKWRAATDLTAVAAGQAGVRIDDIRIGCTSLTLVSAQSRRVHAGAGTRDLPLSLVATNPTTEPRQGPTQTIVITFSQAITGATATVTEGTATAGIPTFNGNDVVVPLTGGPRPAIRDRGADQRLGRNRRHRWQRERAGRVPAR